MTKICRLCAQEVEEYADATDDICSTCKSNQVALTSYNRRRNAGWQEKAEEAGLELWERQPDETNMEYAIWSAYLNHFPYNPINLRQLATEHGYSYSTVKNTAARWDFAIRLQAYMQDIEQKTKREREQKIVEMNKKNVSMAEKLAAKLDAAIEALDPTAIGPREMQGLLRVQAELGREALEDTTIVEAPREALPQGAAAIEGNVTPVNEIDEVLKILGQAKKIGVRQTTTEVLVDKEG